MIHNYKSPEKANAIQIIFIFEATAGKHHFYFKSEPRFNEPTSKLRKFTNDFVMTFV